MCAWQRLMRVLQNADAPTGAVASTPQLLFAPSYGSISGLEVKVSIVRLHAVSSSATGGTFNTRLYKTGYVMNLSLNIGPIVALVAGILILLVPRLLNYIVAIYLIVIGLIGLFGMGSIRI